MQNVLVTGAAGTLGRLAVTHLSAAGYRVRGMGRREVPEDLLAGVEWERADLQTGEGLVEAVRGMDVIVHVASSPFKHTWQIDVEGTRRLLNQAREAGVAHVVYISIVGIERIPFAYYQAKLAAERLIQNSGLAWSVLRATQFHSLIDLGLQALARFPLLLAVPTDLRFQLIDQDEVAQRLCEVVQAGPAGRLPDIGGPEVCSLGELTRNWLRARGMRRIVLPFRLPGKVARGFRRGDNTCPQQAAGKRTWDEWLKQKYGCSSI